jgi:hypothetical protein
MFPTKHTTPILLLALLLAGCSTNVGKTIQVSGAQLAQYDSMSKTEAVAALELRLAKERSAKLPFLAPHYYAEAQELFIALQTAPENTPKNIWVADIAKAHTLLDKGESVSVQVRERFPRELELKGLLDQFNANESYPDDYKEVIGDFSKLIEKVELGKPDNLDSAKKQLIKEMGVLDVKAVQYSALHESDLVNQNTGKKLDVKLAPVVYGETLRVYADATKRIADAPHNTGLVKRASEEAMFAAYRAWFITERMLALQKLSLEGVALSEEQYLSDLTAAIGHKDLRDQALFKQVQIIGDAAKAAIQDQSKLGTSQNATSTLEKRLKESDALIQQCNTLTASLTHQVAEKDAQLKAAPACQSDAISPLSTNNGDTSEGK